MMPSALMQVLNAVVERLMDFDEKVRSSAIAAICDAAVKNLQVDPWTFTGPIKAFQPNQRMRLCNIFLGMGCNHIACAALVLIQD